MPEQRRVVLGIGFSSGAMPEDIMALAARALAAGHIDRPHIIASLDLRYGDPVWAALAARYDCALAFFSAEQLEVETPRLQNPSEAVFRAVGCHGVAEAAALAGAGPDGALIVTKMALRRATAALAAAPIAREQ